MVNSTSCPLGMSRVSAMQFYNKEGVKEVSPLRVLLGAVEIAQSRGAFRMSEMNLITQNDLDRLEVEYFQQLYTV